MPVYTVFSSRESESLARALARRFAIAIGLLLGIVIVSTIVLAIIDRQGGTSLGERIFLGLWDTLNLISTVGSLDKHTSHAERAWEMVVIIFGLGAVLYAFGTVQALLHGEAFHEYRRRRLRAMLEKLNGHVVVCGYGGVGRETARRLADSGRQIVIVDLNESVAHEADSVGFVAVCGDCKEEQTLRDAGVERAGGLVAVLNDDATNVYVALIARELNPDIRLVAHAGSEESRRALQRAGADRVIVPGETAGMQLAHLLLKPRVSEFLAAAVGDGEYEFSEIAVRDLPDLAGRALGDVVRSVEQGIVVLSVIRSDVEQFNPPPDYELGPDDHLIVVTKDGGLDSLATD